MTLESGAKIKLIKMKQSNAVIRTLLDKRGSTGALRDACHEAIKTIIWRRSSPFSSSGAYLPILADL